jgi:hypothetical protein
MANGGLLGAVLAAIAEGGIYAEEEVARRVGVNGALLAAMVDGLVARGYLTVVGSCSAACDHCTVAGACGMGGQGLRSSRVFALTRQGREALGRLHPVAGPA